LDIIGKKEAVLTYVFGISSGKIACIHTRKPTYHVPISCHSTRMQIGQAGTL
jgi:hypothetical protein